MHASLARVTDCTVIQPEILNKKSKSSIHVIRLQETAGVLPEMEVSNHRSYVAYQAENRALNNTFDASKRSTRAFRILQAVSEEVIGTDFIS